MHIVVTGSSGFIGSILTKELCHSGFEVIGIDIVPSQFAHNQFTFIHQSINDPITTLQKGDILIHLAAISSLASCQEDPSGAYTNNVSGTAAVLEAARVAGVSHFIFASTSAIYENSTEPLLSEHSVHPLPTLMYSLGKHHCEDIVRSVNGVYGLPYTILRFFNVFGPGADENRKFPALIPYIIREFTAGRQPILHSNGSQCRDYVYVTDVTELVRTVIRDGPFNDVFNVCSGKSYSVHEIVENIQEAMGTTIQPIYRDPTLLWEKADILWTGEYTFSKQRMTEEVEKTCIGDPSKARSIIGWSAKVSMEKGIRTMI